MKDKNFNIGDKVQIDFNCEISNVAGKVGTIIGKNEIIIPYLNGYKKIIDNDNKLVKIMIKNNENIIIPINQKYLLKI